MILRRPFLALGTMKNQLKGIGGPGAPHCFRLDRMKDLGHVLSQMNVFLIPADFFSSTFMKHMRNTFQNNQGLRHDQVDTKFWRGRGVTFSEDDVVLRTSGVDPSRVDCCYITLLKANLSFKDKAISIRWILVWQDFPVSAHQRCQKHVWHITTRLCPCHLWYVFASMCPLFWHAQFNSTSTWTRRARRPTKCESMPPFCVPGLRLNCW